MLNRGKNRVTTDYHRYVFRALSAVYWIDHLLITLSWSILRIAWSGTEKIDISLFGCVRSHRRMMKVQTKWLLKTVELLTSAVHMIKINWRKIHTYNSFVRLRTTWLHWWDVIIHLLHVTNDVCWFLDNVISLIQ